MSVNSQSDTGNATCHGPICVVDFANYPFIRRFAGELYQKRSCAYVYHPGFQSPNQGQKQHQIWEYPVATGETFAKQNLIRRRFQERAWARAATTVLDTLFPRLVVVANAPLEVANIIQRWCHAHNTPLVFWLQDVHSYAIAEALRHKLPVVGSLVARYYRGLERRLLRASERVLLISDDHRAVLDDLQVPPDRARVLPNWSTIEDFPHDPAEAGIGQLEQAWRTQHGLVGQRLLMYSGTLGTKHDPGLLADLAEACNDDADVSVVVISSGPGADWLRAQALTRRLGNLHVLPFVDYSMIATTLQAAEILLAILEPAAARFSVPSKILTYACAGRPVVVAMSEGNASARLIRDVGFGTVTPPGDSSAFVNAVRTLLGQPQDAADLGRRGRAYAETNFAMPVIETRFMAALDGVVP
jgi:colanic acid biosynthesis glycosyl transferase WcaI